MYSTFHGNSHSQDIPEYAKLLGRIAGIVDFDALAMVVDETCPVPHRVQGDHPAHSTERMVRIVFLQALYGNLSDNEMEDLLLDRLSWRRFIGARNYLEVPSANAIGQFKLRLTDAGGVRALVAAAIAQLTMAGFMPQGGQILDATIVDVSAQRERGVSRRFVVDDRRVKPERRKGVSRGSILSFDTRQKHERRQGHGIDYKA